MKENTSGLSDTEIAKLTKVREEYRSGQRSKFPTDPRWEFARRRRDSLLRKEFNVSGQTNEDSAAIKAAKAHLEQGKLEMPLLEHAEDIRARIEARARSDSRAARSIVKDRANGVPVTRLRMQMREERQSEAEIINLGIVVGTDRGNEDGTVLINSLLVKRDQAGRSVESQHIEARILRGGKFSLKKNVVDLRNEGHKYDNTYSVVYPAPYRPESHINTMVADEEKARILLQHLEFLVDRCLTQPKLSFSPKIDHRRRTHLK